jgi:hypothetical protein
MKWWFFPEHHIAKVAKLLVRHCEPALKLDLIEFMEFGTCEYGFEKFRRFYKL